jgi:pentatricopeptide repeat protein
MKFTDFFLLNERIIVDHAHTFFYSLLVHVLCKLNRLTEALDLLEGIIREAESEDRPRVDIKLVFPVETVMTLTKAVEATTDKVLLSFYGNFSSLTMEQNKR